MKSNRLLMRKALPALPLMLFAFIFSAVMIAGNLTEAELNEGVAQLERTRAAVTEATKGLSEAQWKFKPAPDRWSVAEVLEHIVLVEDALFEHTSKTVMQAPAGKADRDYKSADKMVLTAIADRSTKVKAPEPLTANGRWSPQESLDRFLKSRARTIDYLKSTRDLRAHVVDSPLGQPLDAYQWLLYISAHSERHTKQILEVKADPGFPKE